MTFLQRRRHALAEAKLAAVEGIVADTIEQALSHAYWHQAEPSFTAEAIARSVMSKLARVTIPRL